MKTKRAAATGPIVGPWALPDGWRWERLEDAGRWGSGGTPNVKEARFYGGDIPWFRSGELLDRPLGESEIKITGEGLRGSSAKLLEPGAVLVAMYGATVGRLAISTRVCATNQAVASCIPDPDRMTARYLFYYLLTIRQHLRNQAQGGAQPNISQSVLKEQIIPVPPRAIQESIVARIDELFTEIDDGEAALGRARKDLGTWRKALLKAAVTGELTADWRAAHPSTETGADLLARILVDRRARWEAEPKNKGKRYPEPTKPASGSKGTLPDRWATAAMPQLGDFGRGKSKHRPRNDPKLYGGPYPFVQTGVVSASRGRIFCHDQTYTEMGLAQSKLWPAKTLCITIAANIAKTGVLQFDACFPDSVVGLTCAPGVTPEYVELVIQTLQQGLEANAPATAQKNINLETLEILAIPLPPTNEQAAIVAAFEDAEATADLLTRPEIDATAATLRQSILVAAFRGELS